MNWGLFVSLLFICERCLEWVKAESGLQQKSSSVMARRDIMGDGEDKGEGI